MFCDHVHSVALLLLCLCCVISTEAQGNGRLANNREEEDPTPKNNISKVFKLTVNDNFITLPNFKVTSKAKNLFNLNDDGCGEKDDDDDEENVEVTPSPTSTPTDTPTKTSQQPSASHPKPESTQEPTTTNAPSERTRVSFSCPDQSEEESLNHTIILIPSDTLLSIRPSEKDTLCSLNFMMSTTGVEEDVIIPIGRSYHGNSWEPVPGPMQLMFECDDNSKECTTDVPDKNSFLNLMNDEDDLSDGYFQLTTFNIRNITSQDIAARFLEQSTFGITKTDLEPWMDLDISNSLHGLDDSFADWIENQMNGVEATSHRKYYRERATTRAVTGVVPESLSIHPCAPGTRWRKYSFTHVESISDYYKNQPLLEIEETPDGSYLLLFDGKAFTETDSIEVNAHNKPTFNLTVGEKYALCTKEWVQREHVGGRLCVKVSGVGERYFLSGNPQVRFNSAGGKRPDHVIQVDPSVYNDMVQTPNTDKIGEDLVLPNGIIGQDEVCNKLSHADYPVFLDFQDGRWLALEKMLKLIENDLESPAENGGLYAYLRGASCPNAYRTFMNEDTCIFSGDVTACSNEVDNPDFEIPLTSDDIVNLFSLTGRYVYAVDDLPPGMSSSPCIVNKRSRWLNIGNSDSCVMTTFSDDTGLTLSELIKDALEDDDGISDTLDILYRNNWDDCSIPITEDLTANPVFIIAGGSCYKLVHPDHHSVFDFTEWVSNHPGMAQAITQFAEDGDAFLSFPSHHELSRWDQGESFREYVGRLDRKSSFRDLPASLQLGAIMADYGFDSLETDSKVLICGSPNEAATDLTKGEHGLTFHIKGYDFDTVSDEEKYDQKYNTWTKLVTYSDDQLRQKMAWALSQIFPLSQEAIGLYYLTESFLNYYDIFVSNSFGNYFNILKEVSYSVLMGYMLSYFNSKSTAYTLEKYGIISFADENFAREIMQLFTIGTIMLNMDGSPILDENGDEILSYTNDHIMSYARAWTGFERQGFRGNIEISTNFNKLDPMKIIPEWRDVFPKMNLMNGHIGDHYPLCVDLPARHFLRKGATYRLLGSKTRLELQENLKSGDLSLTHVNVTLDESSELFAKLCNDPSNSGDCNFLSKVVLDENLNCFDRECNVDTLGIVQVTGIWFEYLRQPCVELAYYNDAKVINIQNRGSTGRPEMCANPKLEAAGEACCAEKVSDVARGANCEYTFEKMTFDTSADRCQDIGQTTCDYRELEYSESRPEYNPHPECFYYWLFPHWVDTECLLKVKVDGSSGKAAIVHDTLNPYLSQEVTVQENVRESTPNFFSVYWEDEDFPSFDNNCGNNVCVSVYDGCVCDTSVIEEAVFNEAPNSKEEVMELLVIGSVSPDTFDESYYDDAVTQGDVVTFFRAGTGQSYDMETIFKVQHLSKTYFLRNMRSTVVILDQSGSETQFTFRNPPHFLDIHSGDARDAHYETQAVLESYFYHPNVPPFLAIHFINRFGISNPSPRYIEAVATAFKTGVYEYEKNSDSSMMTFGSNKYGNLEATIAAVLLDREARSIVLDSDPTYGGMREPLMKIISVFRAMEYAPDSAQRSQSHNMVLRDMTDRIGQMVHDYQSIFSFFRREFAPVGPILQGNLVAPEGQRYNSPNAISLMNGLYALVKFGLTECNEGFGYNLHYKCLDEGEFSPTYGHLAFSPEDPDDMESVVDELALLLTANRLDSERRSIIARVASEAKNTDAGLRVAQQLVISSPEFHTTSMMRNSGVPRDVPEPPGPSDRPYKAVVVLMLTGGLDSYNLIIPHSNCDTDMYAQYVDVRGSVHIPYSQLADTIIPAKTNQVCDNFAIHPDLPLLKTLYDEDNLSFFANTGVLSEYVTKETWRIIMNKGLFAHNIQQRDTQQVNLVGRGTGVCGRIADDLTDKGFQTGSFSISGDSYILTGQPSKSPLPIVVHEGGLPDFNREESVEDMNSLFFDLNNATTSFSGKFGKTWSDIFDSAIRTNAYLSEILSDLASNTDFPSSGLGKRLSMVSNIMRARDSLGHDRQFFFVDGGAAYDTHSHQLESDDVRMQTLNDALEAFVDEMKDQGLWDDVTLMEISDFARTMRPNSGEGTDHAWGGNYFMFGGSVKSQILGTYPSDLSDRGDLNIGGGGRFIPTTAFDEIWNSIAEWMGVDDAAGLNKILPGRNNFNLFSESDIFK